MVRAMVRPTSSTAAAAATNNTNTNTNWTSEVINEVIRHCKSLKQLHQAHALTITSGQSSLLQTHILTAFTALLPTPTPAASSSSYALSLFHRIPNPSTFAYNTIIRALTLLSSPLPALDIFLRMRRLSVPPDTHTFPFSLKASSLLPSLSLSQALHSQVFKFGFAADLFVSNTLIHIYSLNNHLHLSSRVFHDAPLKDVVSYNALLNGFLMAGHTLRARQLFDEMPARDAVSWGTLLAAYAQSGGDLCFEAIRLFNRMLASSVRPDNIALVSALSACAQLGDLEQGKSIHLYIKQNRIPINAFLSTGLVDLYAKCGCMETAREIFESSPEKNLFTWNAFLGGLGMHGHGRLLLRYFSRMIEAGMRPDGVSFLGILVGCSHAGLVGEARRIFEEMEEVYGVGRELKHYGCMADLLGRAGLIREAVEMIEGMPMGGDVFVWGGVLGGCRIHGNVEIAEKAAEKVILLNPADDGVYSIMADIYANAGRWDDVARMRGLMNSRQVKKNPGCSLLQFN